LQVVLVSLIPLLFVLVQAIVWPGYIYCTEKSCPATTSPQTPDSATIPIVATLYVYCFVLSSFIVLSSGAWMKYAFRNKLIVITTVFFMVCSVILMVAPATSRGYVFPYYSFQKYNFTIVPTGPNSAKAMVSNIYSSYLDGRNVLLQVRSISSNTKELQNVSPLSPIIYADSSYEDTNTINSNTTLISTEVTNLQQDNWYLWTMIPATNAVGNAAIGNYISSVSSPIFIEGNNNVQYQGSFLDLRCFQVCQWNTVNGCQFEFH